MKFSGHAMKRLQERYGIKWTPAIEADIAAQWRGLKGRDPDPRTDGRACVWYTFTADGRDVRLLVDIHTKNIVTCGPAGFLTDPLARANRKPTVRKKPVRLRGGKPRFDFDNGLDAD